MTSFGYSSQDQSIGNNSKIILTHLLRRWNGNTYNSYPIKNELTPSENVALRILYIELK